MDYEHETVTSNGRSLQPHRQLTKYMSNATLTQDDTNKTTESDKAPDFGSGRYSNAMAELYDSMVNQFGIDGPKAEKIARQAGSDAGAAQRNSVASFKIGKVTKDGKVSVKDMVEAVKGFTATNPLMIVRAIQWSSDAYKNGVHFSGTEWKLTAELQKYVDELEVKSPATG
jgi:hypothetical protein